MKQFSHGIKVAGRAVTYFGSQSISNDTSAVFELIKNSRDADATEVLVSFEATEGGGQRIIIDDDGDGMTYGDITTKWLVAGTDSKSRNTRSRKGKTVWGEMGIGRFACERLADKTTMESYPRGEGMMIQMSFDWSRYEKPGVTFDEVEHSGYMDEKDDVSRHGLRLILENIKGRWTGEKIRSLVDDLGAFILPPEVAGPADMKIVVNAKQYGINGECVRGTVARDAPLKMWANFDGARLTVKISDMDHNKGTLVDRDPGELPDGTSCGPLTFALSFYPRDVAKKGSGKRESYYRNRHGGLDIGEFLKQHSGVYLYRDGVWVKPLGGKNDWLGLEARRVQRNTRLGLSQVYGIIKISHDTNPDIRPTAHRETIQDNDAFRGMQYIILKSITAFERYMDERRSTEEQQYSVEDRSGELARNNTEVLGHMLKDNRDKLPEATYQKMRGHIKAIKKNQELAAKENDREARGLDELRSHEDAVAAIGLLTSYMAQEVAAPLNDNAKVLVDARNTIDSAGDSGIAGSDMAKYREWMTSLEANTSIMLRFVRLVRALSKHISTSTSRKGGPVEFSISEAWDVIADGFRVLTDGLGIKVLTHVDGEIWIRSSMIDLEAILANLFLNSVDALRHKRSGVRQIRLDAEYSSAGLSIRISDNGRGMAVEHLERVFEPFYTVVEEPDNAAHGHGLGLAIVKELVDRHGGKAVAESPSQIFGEGTAVTISFPPDRVPKVAVVR